MENLKVKVGVGSTKTKKVIWDGGENDPYIDVVALSDEAGNVASVQYPLPTDGDSIYEKDVNVAGSNVGTFAGNIVDLFNDYGPSIKLTDVSSANPKSFTIVFMRPVETDSFGLGSSTKTISNVTISLKDQFGADRFVVDDSSNNTKYSSKIYSFEPEAFISATVEFHTADQVDLSGARLPKDVHVTARIKAQKPDGTPVNINATAGGNLKTSLEEFETTFYTDPLPVREYPPDLDGSNYLSVHLLAGAAVDMAVNGSVTPVDYSYTVPAGKKLSLSRLLTAIEDGTQAFIPGNFGAGSALSNGLEISITPSGGSKQILETWKTNREIRDTMFDFDQQFKSNGAYIGRWTIAKDIGTGLTLTAGDVINARAQDDLSILDYLSIRIKAKIENV